jgi:hypothetical protein
MKSHPYQEAFQNLYVRVLFAIQARTMQQRKARKSGFCGIEESLLDIF